MCALADLSGRLDSALAAPAQVRGEHLTSLLSRLAPKELAAALPPIVAAIFGNDGRPGWGLRSSVQTEVQNARALYEFLKPNGTIFHLCYKLISDPQLKYIFPVHLLPKDVVQILENGRIPQFYLDVINVDPHTRQIVSLSLNPFDYYIFHFAVHLYCTSYTTETWDAWDTVYYELACEYLVHFLPNDINQAVTPHIPYFTGKTPAVSPMQVTNRHSQFPSLLISQEAMGCAGVTSSASTQFHPRGEVWRSETVLQVFIDVWLSTTSHNESISGSMCSNRSTYPASEHVRIARALIKRCHAFSLNSSGDPTSLGELRRATHAMLAPRAHSHISHLMHTWPLDTSFRLVLELWFSYIQPWRYAAAKDSNIGSADYRSEESAIQKTIDASYIPFISENLLTYTEIFQLVVPRFLRMNLAVSKNAIMLFRLTKVFSQLNLVQLLMDAENSVANEADYMIDWAGVPNNRLHSNVSDSSPGKHDRSGSSLENSNNQSFRHQSSIWKSVDGIDPTVSSQYRPLLLGKGRSMARDLLIYTSKALSESIEIVRLREEQLKAQNKGFFASIYNFFIGESSSDELSIEELKKVPANLHTAVNQLCQIFSLDANMYNIDNRNIGSTSPENVPRRMNIDILRSPKLARERLHRLSYMGNPDNQPIRTYENGFLVKILQQLSLKINEMYHQEIKYLWDRNDVIGIISKEIFLPPCAIRTYNKASTHDSQLIRQDLPPRLSLRYFASHTFLFWFLISCIVCHYTGYGVTAFIFILMCIWSLLISFKGLIKWLLKSNTNEHEYDQVDVSLLNETRDSDNM